MNRKFLTSWLPLALFALIMVTPLRPIVLGGVPRGLLGPGRWKAGISTTPAANVPVVPSRAEMPGTTGPA